MQALLSVVVEVLGSLTRRKRGTDQILNRPHGNLHWAWEPRNVGRGPKAAEDSE